MKHLTVRSADSNVSAQDPAFYQNCVKESIMKNRVLNAKRNLKQQESVNISN